MDNNNITFTHSNPDLADDNGEAAFFHVTILICLVIGCVLGNTLVVISIVTTRKLMRPCNIFIGGLAVADIEFTFCHVVAIDAALHDEWRFSAAVCRANSAIIVATAVLSLLHMATIALNRYMYLCHQTKFAWLFTWRASWVQEVMTYIAAILIGTIPGLFLAEARYDERLKTCSLSTNQEGDWVYPVYLTVTVFIAPTIVTAICYSKIHKKVNEVKAKVRSHNAALGNGTQINRQKMALATYIVGQMKSRFMVFLIFVLMFIPFAVLSLLDPFVTLPPNLYLSSALLLCSNTMVNPIIYALYNKGFQDAYKTILHKFTKLGRKKKIGSSNDDQQPPVIIPRLINGNSTQEGSNAEMSDNRAINQAGDNEGIHLKADDNQVIHHTMGDNQRSCSYGDICTAYLSHNVDRKIIRSYSLCDIDRVGKIGLCCHANEQGDQLANNDKTIAECKGKCQLKHCTIHITRRNDGKHETLIVKKVQTMNKTHKTDMDKTDAPFTAPRVKYGDSTKEVNHSHSSSCKTFSFSFSLSDFDERR